MVRGRGQRNRRQREQQNRGENRSNIMEARRDIFELDSSSSDGINYNLKVIDLYYI